MRRTGTAVGGRLHKFAAHFVHAGHLQLASCLVHAGQNGAPCGYLDAVLVAAGVCDHGHVVCKAVHGLLDGGFVVKGTGAHLEPCSVQRALKGPCDGVCRGSGQILPCAAGLPRTGIQQVVQGGALFKRGRLHVVVVIDRIFTLHGFGRSLQKQLVLSVQMSEKLVQIKPPAAESSRQEEKQEKEEKVISDPPPTWEERKECALWQIPVIEEIQPGRKHAVRDRLSMQRKLVNRF